MLEKFRFICQLLLILSMLGLSAVNVVDWSFKPFILGILYSIANVIIFIL
jgi:hypothetical protein